MVLRINSNNVPRIEIPANTVRMEKEYWIRVAHLDSELKGTNDNACFWGKIWKNVFLAKCYEACYEKEDIFIDDFNEIGIIRP